MEEITVKEMSKYIRKKLKISQNKLGKIIDCNQCVISLIEHGYEQVFRDTSSKIKDLYYNLKSEI